MSDRQNSRNHNIARSFSEFEKVSETDFDLVDRFFANQLNDEEGRGLEVRLKNDSLLRAFFVCYSSFVSDLQMSARVEVAGESALQKVFESQIDEEQGSSHSAMKNDQSLDSTSNPIAFNGLGDNEITIAPEISGAHRGAEGDQNGKVELQQKKYRSPTVLVYLGIFAALVVGLVLGFWIPSVQRDSTSEPIAWLVNAHACQWSGGFVPAANMQANDYVKLESGLVQIRFVSGADVLIEGPAELILLSSMSAKLNRGRVSVKVPKSMKGFEIYSPQGRVLDLGTEFGVTVSDDGLTDVLVFDGEVETFVGNDKSKPIRLMENQSASISKSEINTDRAVSNDFVRRISDATKLRPRKKTRQTTSIVFDGSNSDGLRDKNDRPIGFASRLPGTGEQLHHNDSNLVVDVQSEVLRLTTTRSDINRQARLDTGEYFGFELSELGFTGEEDFSVTVEIPNIPNLENFGQVGLYCGAKSDQVIRGGFIKWGKTGLSPNTLFMVNNDGGDDSDSNKVGLLNAGIDLQLTLSRIDNKFSLTAENLTDGGTASLSIRHPEYLDHRNDIHVGVFGANPFSDVRKTVSIRKFTINIWK